MIIWLLLFAAFLATLLLTERLDRHATERWPSYARRWARLGLGDDIEQPQHVRVLTVAPEPCRFCGSHGWHDEGCSRLDQWDAPRTETR